MKYINIDLRISGGSDGNYDVSAQSAAGEASGKFHVPPEVLASVGPSAGRVRGVARGAGVSREIVATVDGIADDGTLEGERGRQLSELLLTGDIRDMYLRSYERARLSEQGLRIRLRVQDARLSALPWEFLNGTSAEDYLCLSRETPVVRYLETPSAPEALTVAPPLSILGVISAPSDLPALDVGAERKKIEEATKALRDEKTQLLTLTWLEGSTSRDLMKAMRQGPFHVLHFVGHGDFDTKSDEGTIALTDDAGKSAPIKASDLARLLGDHESLRMVVLNSCFGAKTGATPFSSTASALITRGIPAVVAMQYAISDQAAVVFARELYESIADQMPIDAAVTEARKAIRLVPECEDEWVTPVLHMRSPDGELFSIAGKKTSDFKQQPGFESLGNSAVPPATIGAVMAVWLHRAIIGVVIVATGILLNLAIVAGTDTRLGADYRPSGFIDRYPLFQFISDALKSVISSARDHYAIALAVSIAIAVLAYAIMVSTRPSLQASRAAKMVASVRARIVRPGRPALSALALVLGVGSIVSAYAAAPLTDQLNGNNLTTVAVAQSGSGNLARAQVCKALANDDATISTLDVRCNGGLPAQRIESANSVLNGWLTLTLLLTVVSGTAAVMSRRGPRAAAFRTRWPRANALSLGASATAFTALTGLAFAYGILVRPLRPTYISVEEQGASICEGYLLSSSSDSRGGRGKLYNPASGKIEDVPMSGHKLISGDGRVPDILQQRLVYAASDKSMSEFKSCYPPEEQGDPQ